MSFEAVKLLILGAWLLGMVLLVFYYLEWKKRS